MNLLKRLGLFVVSFFLISCGGGQAPQGGEGGTAAQQEATPKEAFLALLHALADQDWGTVYDSITAESKKELTDGFKEMMSQVEQNPERAKAISEQTGMDFEKMKAMDDKEMFGYIMGQFMQEEGASKDLPTHDEIAKIEILEEKVEGETATLKFKGPDGKEDTVTLAKQDGVWLINFKDIAS